MRRFCQLGLAVVAITAMVSNTNAQWDGAEGLGSYQTILARADLDHHETVANAGSGNYLARSKSPPTPDGPSTIDLSAESIVQSTQSNGCSTGSGCGSVDCGCTDMSMNFGCDGLEGASNRQRSPGLRSRIGNRGCNSSSCTTGYGLQTFDGNVANFDAGACAEAGQRLGSRGLSNHAGKRLGCGTGSGLGQHIFGNSDNSNLVMGVFTLFFERDYEDNRRLGYNGTSDLYSNDVDHNNFDGLGVSIASRGCDGSGWEAIFWGLDEESGYTFAGPTDTYLSGLVDVNHVPSGATVWDIYNEGDSVQLYRDTDIFNFEFNLLRNGGQYTTRNGRTANYELHGGFRLFNFDESMRYLSNSTFGAYPTTIEYRLEAENSLAGIQLGGRNEICLRDRWKLAYSASAGVYNNHVETRQRIYDNSPYTALDYSDTKNDAAMMGQIELGLIYQCSSKSRIRISYRALGVGGVALATDQIPYDFTDIRALTSANSNGSLLLHGLNFGTEFCY